MSLTLLPKKRAGFLYVIPSRKLAQEKAREESLQIPVDLPFNPPISITKPQLKVKKKKLHLCNPSVLSVCVHDTRISPPKFCSVSEDHSSKPEDDADQMETFECTDSSSQPISNTVSIPPSIPHSIITQSSNHHNQRGVFFPTNSRRYKRKLLTKVSKGNRTPKGERVQFDHCSEIDSTLLTSPSTPAQQVHTLVFRTTQKAKKFKIPRSVVIVKPMAIDQSETTPQTKKGHTPFSSPSTLLIEFTSPISTRSKNYPLFKDSSIFVNNSMLLYTNITPPNPNKTSLSTSTDLQHDNDIATTKAERKNGKARCVANMLKSIEKIVSENIQLLSKQERVRRVLGRN